MNKTRATEGFICIAVLVAVLFVGVWQIKPVYSAELPWSNGFETGDFSGWMDFGDASYIAVNSHSVLNGTYGVEFNYTGATSYPYFHHNLATTYPALYVSYWIYLGQAPGGGDQYGVGHLGQRGVQALERIRIYNNGSGLQWLMNYYNATYGDLQSVLSQQYAPQVLTWMHIIVYDNQTSGEYKLFINGNELTDISQTGVDQGSNEPNSFCVEFYMGINGNYVRYDSFIITDNYADVFQTTSSFGYATIGGSTTSFGDNNVLEGCKFTAPTGAVAITQITAYIRGYTGTANARAAVYSSSDGVPVSWLANSSEITGITTSLSWVSFPISCSITTGLTYWLCIFSDVNIQMAYDTGTANQLAWITAVYTYPTFPSVFIQGTTPSYAALVQSIYANITTAYSDVTPPTFGTIIANSTVVGTGVSLTCTLFDNVATSGYCYEWNNTGNLVNKTWTTAGLQPATLVGTWNETVGNKVAVRIFANDTSNNFNVSIFYNFTLTTDAVAPVFGAVTANNTYAGNVTKLQCTITDETGVSGYWWQWDNVGHNVNTTWTAGSIAILEGTWNITVGKIVHVTVFANDTSVNNNTGISAQYNFLLKTSSEYTVVASSGSRYDIQVAVNTVRAHGGGIVEVPTGTYNWVALGASWSTVSVDLGNGSISIIGASVPSGDDGNGLSIPATWYTTIVQLNDVLGNFIGAGEQHWIDVTGYENSYTFRLANIEFQGYRYAHNGTSSNITLGVALSNVFDFRIDHCKFQDICGDAIFAGNLDMGPYNRHNCSGVIDHNVLNNTFGDPGYGDYSTTSVGYGIEMRRWASDVWDTNLNNVWGKATPYTIFIENNYFSRWRHSTCSNDGMYQVVRFNMFEHGYGIGEVDGHGSYADESKPYAVGTRGMEIYNNTFKNPDTRWLGTDTIVPMAVNIRGGTVLVTNNTLISYVGLCHFNDDWGNYAPYVPQCHTNNTYLWGNTMNGAANCTYNTDSVENVNYFYRAPTIALDGISYIPYVYPHPLAIQEGQSSSIVVTITSPTNTTYTTSTISVQISATGGTIDTILWNCKNGTTWIYGSNQTYTVPTSMTGFVDGTSYTFYAWANNTLGEWDEETVMFTVLIIVVPYDWGSFWGDWWGLP